MDKYLVYAITGVLFLLGFSLALFVMMRRNSAKTKNASSLSLARFVDRKEAVSTLPSLNQDGNKTSIQTPKTVDNFLPSPVAFDKRGEFPDLRQLVSINTQVLERQISLISSLEKLIQTLDDKMPTDTEAPNVFEAQILAGQDTLISSFERLIKILGKDVEVPKTMDDPKEDKIASLLPNTELFPEKTAETLNPVQGKAQPEVVETQSEPPKAPPILHCFHCNRRWEQRGNKKPKRCPSCGAREWNKRVKKVTNVRT